MNLDRPGQQRAWHVSIPAAFLVFAGVLALGPWSFESPYSSPAPVPASVTDTTPVRQPRLKPLHTAGVYTYRCSECHRIIASPWETDRSLTQHREIQLRHGLNTRCFNCHHRTNRDAFVDDYGKEIPWDQPQLLCAKCHGPVYRDWQHGSHGRTNGFWDPKLGKQTRRRCIECHDPHNPPFAPMAPAPGPHTLRMGPQDPGPREKEHDPLRVGHGKELTHDRRTDWQSVPEDADGLPIRPTGGYGRNRCTPSEKQD